MTQEKKYRVDGFAEIESRLAELDAQKVGTGLSTHYYTPQPNKDVVKLVEGSGGCEVHMLKEDHGKFTLTEKISLKGLQEGLTWLLNNGYTKADVVAMKHTDYAYGDGKVGLYVINDVLYSVILDFPPGEHETVAKELGVEDAEPVEVPYNKYLERMGRLESVNLKELAKL